MAWGAPALVRVHPAGKNVPTEMAMNLAQKQTKEQEQTRCAARILQKLAAPPLQISHHLASRKSATKSQNLDCKVCKTDRIQIQITTCNPETTSLQSESTLDLVAC